MKHLGIIMDWNRRRAKERLLPAFAWHKAWADNVERIIESAHEKWIKYLTLWGLATENLKKRSKDEVNGIIKLLNSIENRLDAIIQKGLKFDTIWDISQLPEKTQQILKSLKEKTKDNVWIVLILALVYLWQDEIIRWIQKFIKEWWDSESLTRETFRNYIDAWAYPPAEVIVRTGWDIRHSWFLLYDSEYSEYYFTQKKWPEFDDDELEKVIDFFNNAKRNFGK